jgi:hypothetical protein
MASAWVSGKAALTGAVDSLKLLMLAAIIFCPDLSLSSSPSASHHSVCFVVSICSHYDCSENVRLVWRRRSRPEGNLDNEHHNSPWWAIFAFKNSQNLPLQINGNGPKCHRWPLTKRAIFNCSVFRQVVSISASLSEAVSELRNALGTTNVKPIRQCV